MKLMREVVIFMPLEQGNPYNAQVGSGRLRERVDSATLVELRVSRRNFVGLMVTL